MKTVFWIFFTLLNFVKNQAAAGDGSDSDSQIMACNLPLLQAFGLQGLPSPRQGSVVCTSVQNNCCSKPDELFIHKLYNKVQHASFKTRYANYVANLEAIGTILAVVSSGSVNGTLTFFNSTPLSQPVFLTLNTTWTQLLQYNVTNILLLLQNATANLTETGKEVRRMRSGFYCELCDYTTNMAVNFGSQSITLSKAFCSTLVNNYFSALYVKFNVLYPYLLTMDNFTTTATNTSLFGSPADIAEIIRIGAILALCNGTGTAPPNCTAYCSEFHLDEASVLFDGDATIMTTFVTNFNANFPPLMSSSPSPTLFQQVINGLNQTNSTPLVINCTTCTNDMNCTGCTNCQNCANCTSGTNCTNCTPASVCSDGGIRGPVKSPAGTNRLLRVFDTSKLIGGWTVGMKNVKKSYPRILSEKENEVKWQIDERQLLDSGVGQLKGRLLAELVFQDRKGFRNLKQCKKQLYKYTDASCEKASNGSRFLIRLNRQDSVVLGREVIEKSISDAETKESKNIRGSLKKLWKTRMIKNRHAYARKDHKERKLFCILWFCFPDSIGTFTPAPYVAPSPPVYPPPTILPSQVIDYAGNSTLPSDPTQAPGTPIYNAINQSLSLFGNVVDVNATVQPSQLTFLAPLTTPIFPLFTVQPNPQSILNFTMMIAADAVSGTNPYVLGLGNFWEIEVPALIQQLFASDVAAVQALLTIDPDISTLLVVNDREEIGGFLNDWGAGFEVFFYNQLKPTPPPARKVMSGFRVGMASLGVLFLASLWMS